MKSKALKELITNIFNNEKTRNQFQKDPDSVLSQFALSEKEKKAVLITYAKVGLVSGNSQQLEAVLKPTYEWYAGDL